MGADLWFMEKNDPGSVQRSHDALCSPPSYHEPGCSHLRRQARIEKGGYVMEYFYAWLDDKGLDVTRIPESLLAEAFNAGYDKCMENHP